MPFASALPQPPLVFYGTDRTDRDSVAGGVFNQNELEDYSKVHTTY